MDIIKRLKQIEQIAQNNLMTIMPHGIEVIDSEWLKVLEIIKEIKNEQNK